MAEDHNRTEVTYPSGSFGAGVKVRERVTGGARVEVSQLQADRPTDDTKTDLIPT